MTCSRIVIKGISHQFRTRELAGRDDKLRLKAGSDEKFVVKFQEDAFDDQQSYELRLFFSDGCSIDFPPPPEILLYGDSDKNARRSFISTLVGAKELIWEGIDGHGVGVAVIDTGIWANKEYLLRGIYNNERIPTQYDARENKTLKKDENSDKNGHGSHLSSLLVSSRYKDSEFNGIAPNANLIPVRAFDENGQGTYADVIRALDWVVTNKNTYNIRVLNLSFSAPPRSHYWDDPLESGGDGGVEGGHRGGGFGRQYRLRSR